MKPTIPIFCVDTCDNGLQSQVTVGINHTVNTVINSCMNQLSINMDDQSYLSIAQMVLALSVDNDLDAPKKIVRVVHPKYPARFMTLWLMPTKLTEHMLCKYTQLFEHELDTSVVPNPVIELLKPLNGSTDN